MSYQPVIPLDGFVGWRFLQRTLPNQSAAHASTPMAQRDEAYVRENIGAITSAQELVADRRMLRIALTAYGLAEDLPNRAYIEKVLESSTKEEGSFVNRLTDKRYHKLAEAFAFGDRLVPRTQLPSFADDLIAKFQNRSFEEAVGAQNDNMRMALALERDLSELAGQDSSESAKWFTILGTPSLRRVFETAFMLPSSFGTLDIDRQVDILQSRTERLTGSDSISQFTDPEAMNALTERFFLAGQVQAIQAQSAGSSALSLLQNGQASLNALLGR
ncbi:DUF1217 domain-containing protein [Pararhodobacter oceanensis]|uniref:DUF1217 domain-containing protein n=1 Tax=Pararhodobacter oceanensis TaxID=2172121 RepID=UPI003A8C974E